MPRSWKPVVLVDGKWGQNALAFRTEQEAKTWAHDLLMRWFVPTDSGAVESDEEPNYEIVDNVCRRIE